MITVIANLKGGSGKSTVTFNLGLWLQMKGQPVVAYDLDPQKTLSDVAQVRIEEGATPPLQVYTVDEQLKEKLCYHPGQVLVDVGAANMQAMKDAISVSDRVVIPVPPSQPDLWATQRFLKIVDEVTTKETRPELIAFVNRADTHVAIRESDEAEEALNMLGALKVLSERICQRTLFRRTLSEGMSIFELSRRSKSTQEFEQFALSLYPELAKK